MLAEKLNSPHLSKNGNWPGIVHPNGPRKQCYKCSFYKNERLTRVQIEIMDFLIAFLDEKKSRKNNSVRKIVDGLSKTVVRALPYATVWVDKPSPFVFSIMAN